jgi:hypothetical protein
MNGEPHAVQPLKKPAMPTVLAHRQFMDKNKQLSLLRQCNLAFIGRYTVYAYASINSKEHKKI